MQAPIYNEKIVGSFEKTDYAGTEIAGADCELSILKNGNWEVVDRFTSTTDGSAPDGRPVSGRQGLPL